MEYRAVMREDPSEDLNHWKYIKREKVNGKWRYYYKPSKYEVNAKNYKSKKEELTKDKEWVDIVNRKDPEYVYNDEEGKTVYDFDKYLLNKKHPIIDALNDLDQGRKVSTLKQDSDTFLAGAKDYINLGINKVKKALEIVGTLTVGYLTVSFKNQQGSYEDEKAEIRKNVNTAKNMAKDAVKTYNTARSTVTDPTLTREYEKIGKSILKKFLS